MAMAGAALPILKLIYDLIVAPLVRQLLRCCAGGGDGGEEAGGEEANTTAADGDLDLFAETAQRV